MHPFPTIQARPPDNRLGKQRLGAFAVDYLTKQPLGMEIEPGLGFGSGFFLFPVFVPCSFWGFEGLRHFGPGFGPTCFFLFLSVFLGRSR